MAELRVGHFEAFHYGDPALLLWGDEAGLNALASFLLALEEGEAKVLTTLPWVRTKDPLRVDVTSSHQPRGLCQMSETPPHFHWSLSPDLQRDFAEKVRVVATAPKPGHHYLDTDDSEAAVVIVSKGEYAEL
ncbi:MAG: hypothetical protein AAF495_08950 [Pseudomonadota bacterium]